MTYLEAKDAAERQRRFAKQATCIKAVLEHQAHAAFFEKQAARIWSKPAPRARKPVSAAFDVIG